MHDRQRAGGTSWAASYDASGMGLLESRHRRSPMMNTRLSGLAFAACLAVVFGVGPTVSRAADPKPLEMGAAAPDFNLPGVDGKNHALKDFAAAKVLVVLFTCNHCPTAQAYEGRVMKMHADYKDKGVALVAISPNDPLAV